MRISSNQLFQQGLSAMLERQSALSRAQLEISSGQKMLSAADDPVGAVRAAGLDAAIARGEQFIENASFARTRLSAEENAVDSAVNVMQRLRDLTLQANNATQSNESRAAIGREVREQLDNLLQIANTATGDGNYLFAGFQENVKPFSFSNGTLSYHGDDGRREIQLGPSRSVADADPGSHVFAGIKKGNGDFEALAGNGNTGSAVISTGSVTDYGVWDEREYQIVFASPTDYEIQDDTATVIATGTYSEGDSIGFAGINVTLSGPAETGDSFTVRPSERTDVMSIVEQLARELETPRSNPVERAAQTNGLNVALSDISRALDHLVEIQTGIGTRLNVVDQEVELNENVNLQLQQSLSGIRDVDMVEAASRLSQNLTGLQAAQQAFARVQQLSLFDYL